MYDATLAVNDLDNTVSRVFRTAAGLHWPENTIEVLGADTTAQCRWWNSLNPSDREAYLCSADVPENFAGSEWLDIGEANRERILAAVRAVQHWLAA